MRTIGITGGVGAGKSYVMNYIEGKYKAKVYLADDIANQLKLPGESCYEPIVRLLGDKVLDDHGEIDKNKMASIIFAEPTLLARVNQIIHPAVKTYILNEIEQEKRKGNIDFFFFEAALLIEENYDQCLDELWFIYASPECRKKRLMDSRNYSEEKIFQIMEKQLSDEEFMKYCRVIIKNDQNFDETKNQIDKVLGEYISAEK